MRKSSKLNLKLALTSPLILPSIQYLLHHSSTSRNTYRQATFISKHLNDHLRTPPSHVQSYIRFSITRLIAMTVYDVLCVYDVLFTYLVTQVHAKVN